MASYELRVAGKAKSVEIVHDHTKESIIPYADEKCKELGEILEVYMIKQIHVTSLVKGASVEFF